MGLGLMQSGVALAGVVVTIAVALVAMRLIRRVVSGCVTAGVGCLVLVIGLALAVTFLGSELGVTGVQDVLDILSGIL